MSNHIGCFRLLLGLVFGLTRIFQDYYCPWLSIVQSGTIIILKKKQAHAQGEKQRKYKRKYTEAWKDASPRLEEFLSHLLESGPGKKKITKQNRKIIKKSNRRHQKKTGRHRKERRQETHRKGKIGHIGQICRNNNDVRWIWAIWNWQCSRVGWPESLGWRIPKTKTNMTKN